MIECFENFAGMPSSMNDADMMRSAAAAQQIANLYGAQPTVRKKIN
jgi:hypothetical protein